MDDVVIFIIVISIGTICSVFNFLTLAVILSSRNLRRRTSSYPTMSFLIASAFQGMIPAPLYVYRKLEHHPDHYPGWACDMYRFPYLFCGHIMSMSILLVSLDRMVAIKYPFRYENTENKRKMTWALLVLWIITVVVDIVPFIHGSSVSVPKEGCHYQPTRFWGLSVIAFYNILPFLLILVNYSIIWSLAAKFAIKDRARTDSLSVSQSNMFLSNASTDDPKKPLISKSKSYGSIQTNVTKKLSNFKFFLEIKATKTSLVLVAVYLLCWGPLCVFYTADHVCNGCLSDHHKNDTTRTVIKLLNFSSSLLVPLFYCWWNKDYRKTALTMFRKLCCCKKARRKSHTATTTSRTRANSALSVSNQACTRGSIINEETRLD